MLEKTGNRPFWLKVTIFTAFRDFCPLRFGVGGEYWPKANNFHQHQTWKMFLSFVQPPKSLKNPRDTNKVRKFLFCKSVTAYRKSVAAN